MVNKKETLCSIYAPHVCVTQKTLRPSQVEAGVSPFNLSVHIFGEDKNPGAAIAACYGLSGMDSARNVVTVSTKVSAKVREYVNKNDNVLDDFESECRADLAKRDPSTPVKAFNETYSIELEHRGIMPSAEEFAKIIDEMIAAKEI